MSNTSLTIGYCLFAAIWLYFMYHLIKEERRFYKKVLDEQKKLYELQKDLAEQLYEWAENPYINTYTKN